MALSLEQLLAATTVAEASEVRAARGVEPYPSETVQALFAALEAKSAWFSAGGKSITIPLPEGSTPAVGFWYREVRKFSDTQPEAVRLVRVQNETGDGFPAIILSPVKAEDAKPAVAASENPDGTKVRAKSATEAHGAAIRIRIDRAATKHVYYSGATKKTAEAEAPKSPEQQPATNSAGPDISNPSPEPNGKAPVTSAAGKSGK
jgi:hypothetical protein